ncbi:MAG: discoidin domain-containing protein [Clostridia bacterium]|nr:discoidin domain-containing protein [Clostridia bacterium]
MKRFLSCFIAVILVMSLLPVFPAFAESSSLSGSITGILAGNTAIFTVCIENTGDDAEEAQVVVANYNDDGTLKSAKKYAASFDAGVTSAKTYEADVTEGYAKIYVWDAKMRPAAETLSSADCYGTEVGESEMLSIDTDDVWTSVTPESANIAANVVDGDTSTKWTAQLGEGGSESFTAYLDGNYSITEIGVAFGLGNERNYIFSVSASKDGENFVEILPTTTAEKTLDVQYFDTAEYNARYVRVTMEGRTDVTSGWVQLSEFEAYGYEYTVYGDEVLSEGFDTLDDWTVNALDELTYTDYTPKLGSALYAEAESGKLHLYDAVDRSGDTSGEKLEPTAISASQEPQPESYAAINVTDGDLDTIWTASGVYESTPATLTLEYDKAYYLTKTAAAFGLGTSRTYTYEVSVSEDGKTFETVVEAKSSSSTLELQEDEFDQVLAKYVRFTFYGRTDSSDNGWIRIAELEAYGTEDGVEGAGGVIAQRTFDTPASRADYEINFTMNISGNPFYAGVSLTDGAVSGGADLTHYAALQLRFDNSSSNSGKVAVKMMRSNYFNEGTPVALFEGDFKRGSDWDVTITVSPKSRWAAITIDDGSTRETQKIYFAYNDSELTRPSRWTGLEANTLVFNTGAGASCEMYISDLTITEIESEYRSDAALNGVIRLEAVRLSDDATGSAYYGRFVTHAGADANVMVDSKEDPAYTRFVEREGLIGCGVSFEAVNKPGYFLCIEDGTAVLKAREDNGAFYANATFIKESAENLGYYTGTTVKYLTYVNEENYLYDSSTVHSLGTLKAGTMEDMPSNGTFYLRSEVSNYVSDNFLGDTLNSQWWTNFPWKSNNPTHDSYNFSALITKNNVIVEDGELFLKATEIPSSSWPTNLDGDTGINYNGSYSKNWVRWKGYVGVVSIQNKVYNKQCYIEGSFKQPDSPIGYWNAFWLTGRDSWPPEIDIFEFLSSKYGHSSWNIAIHGEGDSGNLGTTGSGVDLTSGYHVFALDWGYDYMRFYVDGECIYAAQNSTTVNYQKNVRLILNTGIGGWEYEPDDTMVWDDGMRCKYIRSYQY